MATQNFYALLGDDENEDPTAVLDRVIVTPVTAAAKQQQPQAGAKKAQAPTSPAKVPGKPADAVRESSWQYEGGGRGRGGRGGRGGGRGGYADREGGARERDVVYSRDRANSGGYSRNGDNDGQGGRGAGGGGYYGDRAPRGEDGEPRSYDSAGRGRGRGRGRGGDRERGYGAEGEERHRRREFDRHSGSGRGTELKRDGAGRGNWGTDEDQVNVYTESAEVTKEEEKPVTDVEEKKVEGEVQSGAPVEDGEEKAEEDNEMTLDEYEKILEEKKRNFSANKAEERKVKADEDFEKMHLVDRKNEEDVFIKLGSEKDKGKKKEVADREEKSRKAVSINEFLKPADGEKYYGRGRGRGRGGDRGGFRGGFAGGFNNARRVSAPRIEDPGQFPTLGGGK